MRWLNDDGGGNNVHGLANSHGGGRFRDWTGCGHREDVVESTISLPLHTVGTGWALTEAGKKRQNNKEEKTDNYKEINHSVEVEAFLS